MNYTLRMLSAALAAGALAAAPAWATGSGSGSGSAGSGSSGGSASSGSAAGSAAGSSAAGDGASASAGSAGPSVPSRESCFDRSVVAWRNTPECSQHAGTPIPSDWARSRDAMSSSYRGEASQAVDSAASGTRPLLSPRPADR